jgi:hypothetical protein
MSDERHRRITVVLVLLSATVGCLIWFGATPVAPQAGVFADNDEVMTDYTTHLNSRVVVSGQVIDTDPLTIRAKSDIGDTIDLRVSNADSPPTEGDVLSVYGTLRQDQQIVAINTVVKPAGNYWRTRVLSALAGLWVLWRGLRHWKPDPRAVLIERQEHKEGSDA